MPRLVAYIVCIILTIVSFSVSASYEEASIFDQSQIQIMNASPNWLDQTLEQGGDFIDTQSDREEVESKDFSEKDPLLFSSYEFTPSPDVSTVVNLYVHLKQELVLREILVVPIVTFLNR